MSWTKSRVKQAESNVVPIRINKSNAKSNIEHTAWSLHIAYIYIAHLSFYTIHTVKKHRGYDLRLEFAIDSIFFGRKDSFYDGWYDPKVTMPTFNLRPVCLISSMRFEGICVTSYDTHPYVLRNMQFNLALTPDCCNNNNNNINDTTRVNILQPKQSDIIWTALV